MRQTTFKTVIGDVKSGAKGEWAKTRVLQTQFQGIEGMASTNSETYLSLR